MKKFFGLFLFFAFTAASALASDMRIIQVDNVFYTPESDKLESIITDINKQKNVEFVIFTGNNIAKPNREYLESFLQTAKQLNSPFYLIPGNKEVNKQKDLGKIDYMKIVSKNARTHKKIESPNYVIDKKDIVFIAVDGSKDVIPSSMGYYKADVLKWLDEQLDIYKDKNVVILQHFPIVPPSKRESHYTFKADEYLKLLAKHKNVKAVVAGHFGVNNEQTVNGVLHISTSDAPVYRIIDILDYDSSHPEFWSIVKELK